MTEADDALNGDSNDAEHDALYALGWLRTARRQNRQVSLQHAGKA
jgi:hypothetical protein